MRVDVLVAGGGLVGAALALALRKRSGGAFNIAIADAAPVRAAAGRAYAVAPASMAFLESLGVGQDRFAAQPVLAMRITDSRLHDPVRPEFLTFERAETPLAHIVDEAELATAVRAAALAADVQMLRASVVTIEQGVAGVAVTLGDGQRISAALLGAADGARSTCRMLAGLPVIDWDYKQTGLVATVSQERDHEGRAVQHFLPDGPFAILPMTGRRSSIVWTDARENAETMLALHPDDLASELERRFGAFLGALTLMTPLAGFPIRFQMARRFVGERIALVGDAAHVIHPLAGQGLNLGLEDADALSARIIAAARLGLDAGDAASLGLYERDRRAAVVGMGVATDLLNRLFSSDWTPARLARDFGLGLVDRAPGLKGFFMRRAAGHSVAA
ncbi:FAD-dependent monooxygenase [Terrarubrum flagellatum]|uniref:FAD-dependent monooxygenase n=1 Tax=Terrirubrum flagellatum TaxID=2895980 RepID=UPI0031456896